MKTKIFSGIKLVFFLSIGFFFIWLFLKDLDDKQKSEILISFAKANYFWVALAIVAGIGAIVFRSLRWIQLIEPLGYKPKLGNVVGAVFIGYFANLALPRLGEITRCGILNRYDNLPMQKGIGTVVTERALDMLSFIVLFLLSIFLQYDLLANYVDQTIMSPLQAKFNFNSASFLIVIAILGLLGLTILYVFRKKLMQNRFIAKVFSIVMGFVEGLRSLTKVEKPFLFLVYTVALWSMYLLSTWICFYCMIETSSLSMLPGLVIMSFGAIGVMVVQGGIGIYPVIVQQILLLYGIQSTAGYAFGWISWTSQTVMLIIGGIISLAFLPFFNKQNGITEDLTK